MVGGGEVGMEVPVVALAVSMTRWDVGGRRSHHRWDLPVLHYQEIMVIYLYPFLVVIIQSFS